MVIPSPPPVTVEPVRNRRQLKAFIRLPWSIYSDDPCWVPPLLFEQQQRLGPKNPFFRHARWQAWTASRNGRIVGRISAQIDDLHDRTHGPGTGFFGMLEAEDDPMIFRQLLETAESWLREQGIKTIRGPFNLSINEESGLLIEGFDTPPFIMMGHSRRWYRGHVESAGYTRAMDMLAYNGDSRFTPPRVMERLLAQLPKGSIRLRNMRRKQLDEDLEIMRDVFNDAWADNWGFVPFTKEEFAEVGKLLPLLVDDDFVQIAEMDGRPVAIIAALPNINEIIADLNGRLLPFGWLKLLWRLKKHYPRTARTPLMGVRREFHKTPLGPALAYLIIQSVAGPLARRGIHRVELSWILETNKSVRRLIESMGGMVTKRYRIYEKPL